jgi:hypothetical protein
MGHVKKMKIPTHHQAGPADEGRSDSDSLSPRLDYLYLSYKPERGAGCFRTRSTAQHGADLLLLFVL